MPFEHGGALVRGEGKAMSAELQRAHRAEQTVDALDAGSDVLIGGGVREVWSSQRLCHLQSITHSQTRPTSAVAEPATAAGRGRFMRSEVTLLSSSRAWASGDLRFAPASEKGEVAASVVCKGGKSTLRTDLCPAVPQVACIFGGPSAASGPAAAGLPVSVACASGWLPCVNADSR